LNLNLNRENVYINNLNSDSHSTLADNNKEMQEYHQFRRK